MGEEWGCPGPVDGSALVLRRAAGAPFAFDRRRIRKPARTGPSSRPRRRPAAARNDGARTGCRATAEDLTRDAWLKRGNARPDAAIMTADALRRIYGVEMEILSHPRIGLPIAAIGGGVPIRPPIGRCGTDVPRRE